MKKFFYNRILIAAIFVGLIASLVIAYQRHVVETNNMQVDVAVDYDSLWNLAEREGLSLDEVLVAAKDAGVTSIAVYDTNFTKLAGRGKVIVLPGHNILSNYYSGLAVDPNWLKLIEAGAIDPNKVYILGHDMDVYAQAREDLIRRIGEERVNVLNVGDNEVLEVKAQYGSFMAYNLGMPTEELETAKNFGFTILARPSNYFDCSEDDVRAVFERLDGYPISEVVFAGAEVLGSPKVINVTAEEMKNRNLTLGLIESTTQLQFYYQAGMNELARMLGYDHVARLYAIPNDELPKLLPVSNAVARWASTDHERNIRINLLRIYERPIGGLSMFETNMRYFRETTDLLKSKGYSLGAASTFANYYPSAWLRALVMIGVAASIVLYVSLISKRINSNAKLQVFAFIIIAVLMAVPVLIGAGGKVRLFAAFAAANVFPALAIIWQLDSIRFLQLKERLKMRKIKGSDRTMAVKEPTPILQIIILAAIALLVTGAMSMAGAAYLSGALSDVEYFLELNIFRGIKLTFILPLLLVAVAFLQRFNIISTSPDIKSINAIAQLKRILNLSVSVKAFIAIIIISVALVVLIARSGHTSGMPVSSAEMHFRSLLENAFYARPRSKELLIGHPAFMLAIMAYFQRWSKVVFFVLVIVATIGQGSMVETFAHMRTPIFMSLMRGVDGLALGAAIGIIPMLIFHWCATFRKNF